MIKYSFIIPTLNNEKTINKCLDSIFSQNSDNFEIIIVNDGSTDDTAAIINDYLKKHEYIKSFYIKNSGPSVARNLALKKARGEYIIFVDADDYLETDLLKQVELYTNDDYDLIKCWTNYHGNRIPIDSFNTSVFFNKSGEQALLSFINDNKLFSTPWSYIYKRKLLTKNRLFFAEGKLHEDYGLLPLIIHKSEKVCSIPIVGYNYTYTENGLSTDQSYDKVVKRAFDMLFHCKNLYDYAINNFSGELKEKFLINIKNNLLNKKNKLREKELIGFELELKKSNII